MDFLKVIAQVLQGLGSTAGAVGNIYSAIKGGGFKTPGLPTIPKSDLASMGAMKGEMFSSATPQFKSGMSGAATTAPLPGAGGLASQPLLGSGDQYAELLKRMQEGQSGSMGGD